MGMFSRLAGWLKPAPPLSDEDRLATEQAAAAVDPLLKTVPGFERRLAPALRHALAYCETLVAKIPGPIDISPKTFASDPLVHAIFGSAADVCTNLCMSCELREYLLGSRVAEGDAFYALLGMRRHEKSVMGMALMGEVVRSDVPQTVVYFADHTLTGVSPSFDEARGHLREAAIDGLLKGFAAELAERREARKQLHDEWEMARGRVRLREPGAGEVLAGLTARLQAADASLAPERLADGLAAWLAAPERHLRLESASVTVDAMGIKVEPESGRAGVHTLEFPELVGRDRRRWLILLVRLPRAEMAEAMARHEDAHRYIVI